MQLVLLLSSLLAAEVAPPINEAEVVARLLAERPRAIAAEDSTKYLVQFCLNLPSCAKGCEKQLAQFGGFRPPTCPTNAENSEPLHVRLSRILDALEAALPDPTYDALLELRGTFNLGRQPNAPPPRVTPVFAARWAQMLQRIAQSSGVPGFEFLGDSRYTLLADACVNEIACRLETDTAFKAIAMPGLDAELVQTLMLDDPKHGAELARLPADRRASRVVELLKVRVRALNGLVEAKLQSKDKDQLRAACGSLGL